jgi:hypothetical protein
MDFYNTLLQDVLTTSDQQSRLDKVELTQANLDDARLLYNRQWVNISNLVLGMGSLLLYLYYSPTLVSKKLRK